MKFLNRTANFSNLPFCSLVENIVIPFLLWLLGATLVILGTAVTGNAQTMTMTDVRQQYGEKTRLEKSYAPTLWRVAQGAGECASYLVSTLQKRDGNGNLFKATYLVGYDSDDNQILEILVTDFVLSTDGKQASVMQNGFRIDLSGRLE